MQENYSIHALSNPHKFLPKSSLVIYDALAKARDKMDCQNAVLANDEFLVKIERFP
jgi:hypothetical protein